MDIEFGFIFLVLWIGVGVFLLYIAIKKGKETKLTEPANNQKEKTHTTESALNPVQQHDESLKQQSDSQLESVEDIQAQLTIQQREAAMCLISYFGGYNDDLMNDVPIMIIKQAAFFFGLPYSPFSMSQIMSKYTDADYLVDIVLTIKHVKAKEFLLLTCYDLIKSSDKTEAYNLLFNIANDMGYNETQFTNLIKLYQ